jgi:ATP-dependent DNA helicase RecG
MTATPIPRTLAVTVFGDLDVSTLTELPAGRKEITSHVVQINQGGLVARVWARVAEEVSAGRQAFVVCPRIDEADTEPELVEEFDSDEDVAAGDLVELATPTEPKAPLAAALSVAEALKLNPTLAGVSIDVLHGRMSSEQKAEVMARFIAKEIDVLVSTTVIEVGVDVPNATVMVVLDADRFGISQLHQLRGRVGRGGLPGLCLLLTTAEPGAVSLERLTAVASTTDGFKLSEIDLELRREGDVLGKSQSGGRSSLKLLRVVQDAVLIGEVRGMAAAVFESDPTLEKHPALAEALERIDQQAQENLAKT